MNDVSQIIAGDELGPQQVLFVHDHDIGLQAVAVVDNVAAGPSIGGIRMATDVSLDEVRRLARAMTFKNAAAGLPHGGGKAGIVFDHTCDPEQKERLVRRFARLIAGLHEYIPGPDMGTDETCMAWIKDEIERSVGLPRVLGGIPLDEIGATGLGLAAAADVAAPAAGLELEGARVAVQGFGAVGIHAARFLAQRGARLVAASDSHGAVEDERGLDLEALAEHKRSAPVAEFPGARKLERDALVGVDCDIWIPAARPDVLTADNVGELKARLVLQGANIPATPEAERIMHERGVVNVPDFIANAGGVICAACEYHGVSESQALTVITDKISANVRELLELIQRDGLQPREAAQRIAKQRLREAMSYRR